MIAWRNLFAKYSGKTESLPLRSILYLNLTKSSRRQIMFEHLIQIILILDINWMVKSKKFENESSERFMNE